MMTFLVAACALLLLAAAGAWTWRRLSRRPGGEGRFGAAVFTVSALSLSGLFVFLTVFFWVTR
ncbi:MAG: hypothetical protein P0Y50_09440 [Candidatus Brevundimonas colombiensis]|uniref:Uncharacterized protein n=1 Tax=Candidatus Brevundimonas colombiensis TaxID=3121376 RepID=A0AAJ5X0D7_9CAUL|nr:hypothetical protein [Brevundimonas sp.]WEK38773.1 MAG: hypothetical protein P0Y50_09440 [Brevundimonas sp.]